MVTIALHNPKDSFIFFPHLKKNNQYYTWIFYSATIWVRLYWNQIYFHTELLQLLSSDQLLHQSVCMSLLPLEPLQKLIDIGMVLGYYGVEATVPSSNYIVHSGLIGNSTHTHSRGVVETAPLSIPFWFWLCPPYEINMADNRQVVGILEEKSEKNRKIREITKVRHFV